MTEFANYPSLKGKVVFISGGASGIGSTLVKNFAGQGARVAFVDIMDELGQALVEELSGAGHEVRFYHCDLTDIAALRQAIERTRNDLGPVGALLNNAARDDRHDFDGVTPDYWDASMAVNFRHQYFAAQAVRSHMKTLGGGSIINFSSVAWMFGTKDLSVYASAKAAVLGLTRSLGRELGADNIRVNAIAPGPIMTERQREMWFTTEAAVNSLVERQAIHTVIAPEEVARMALFLAADDSRLVTRQCINVDAGIR
jgi:NAD(P)-dependent dehydrogenase (short-subunit alcohol dehydrogenase family)